MCRPEPPRPSRARPTDLSVFACVHAAAGLKWPQYHGTPQERPTLPAQSVPARPPRGAAATGRASCRRIERRARWPGPSASTVAPPLSSTPPEAAAPAVPDPPAARDLRRGVLASLRFRRPARAHRDGDLVRPQGGQARAASRSLHSLQGQGLIAPRAHTPAKMVRPPLPRHRSSGTAPIRTRGRSGPRLRRPSGHAGRRTTGRRIPTGRGAVQW